MPKYVIQEHHARQLHFDFRLEMDGVLKSWAVPKGPPTEVGVKRLAVEVDDHDIDYADFEGTIEEGYGKGSVKIWDSGSYELDSLKPEKIVFILKGSKLKGRYVLFLPKWSKGKSEGKRQWLLMRAKDSPKKKIENSADACKMPAPQIKP